MTTDLTMRVNLRTTTTPNKKYVVYILVYVFVFEQNNMTASHNKKNRPHSILQVPTTQLAKMSIYPKFVDLTADVFDFFFKILLLSAAYRQYKFWRT